MQNKRIFGMLTAAGCALCAASAMGAVSNVVSNDFESVEADSQISLQEGWTGYGTVTNGNPGYANTVGYPTALGHTKVLAVEGRVTCSNTTMTASKPTTVDMMVQIATPDDALAFPSGTDTGDIQIAVGVDTDATLKIWCKNKSNAAAWYSLGSTAYDVGSWHRVSFTFDYANALCQVRVDGEPMMTANGYLTTDTTNLDTADGSWYKLAASSIKLVSVQVIGSTSIDDLLVKQDAAATTVDSVLPVLADAGGTQTINGEAVPNSWIEAQGITRDTTTAPDGSGMGVGAKYAAGYDVSDGKTFGVKTMSMSGTSATVTFDAANVKTGYTYVLSTSTDNSTWSDATTISSAEALAGSKTIDLGDAAVKYLKLKVIK